MSRTENLCGLSWTSEEDAKLEDLVIKGVYYADIAEHFTGRSRSACMSRAKRLGISQRAPEKENWNKLANRPLFDKALNLYHAGMSGIQISEIPGMPGKTTVQKMIARQHGPKALRHCTFVATPIGDCSVSGKPLYRLETDEHCHVIPEAILEQAKKNRCKWGVKRD